jgi:hypothetical protein
MNRYAVYSSNTLVGHSALEGGDPPMGVAIGQFFPLPAYEQIQVMVVSAFESSQERLNLVVVDTQSGLSIPAQGGVQILDVSKELGPEGMEVHVLGIGYPLYEELFPGRHAKYEASFTNAPR